MKNNIPRISTSIRFPLIPIEQQLSPPNRYPHIDTVTLSRGIRSCLRTRPNIFVSETKKGIRRSRVAPEIEQEIADRTGLQSKHDENEWHDTRDSGTWLPYRRLQLYPAGQQKGGIEQISCHLSAKRAYRALWTNSCRVGAS